jgi:hypothetical protein
MAASEQPFDIALGSATKPAVSAAQRGISRSASASPAAWDRARRAVSAKAVEFAAATAAARRSVPAYRGGSRDAISPASDTAGPGYRRANTIRVFRVSASSGRASIMSIIRITRFREGAP